MFESLKKSIKVYPCIRCGSSRVLVGNGSARMSPFQFKEFAASVLPNIIGLEDSHVLVCLDCGLFTGNVDVARANKIFETYANDDLKKELM